MRIRAAQPSPFVSSLLLASFLRPLTRHAGEDMRCHHRTLRTSDKWGVDWNAAGHFTHSQPAGSLVPPFLTGTLPPRSKTQTEVRTNGKAKQAVCDQGWGKPCMNRRHKGTD